MFEKLEKAKFTGKLILEIERGEVMSADLNHSLPTAELNRPLPVIDEPFELEP